MERACVVRQVLLFTLALPPAVGVAGVRAPEATDSAGSGVGQDDVGAPPSSTRLTVTQASPTTTSPKAVRPAEDDEEPRAPPPRIAPLPTPYRSPSASGAESARPR